MHLAKTCGDEPNASANKFTYPSRRYPKVSQKTTLHYVSNLCQTRGKNFQNLLYVKQNLNQKF